MEIPKMMQMSSSPLAQKFTEVADKASEEKKDYTGKLEGADGEEVFKYLLLVDLSYLEGYVAQTRMQAEQSFQLCKRVAIAGFVILAIGIGIGITSNLIKGWQLEVAYLAGVAGVLTEFISGVFFYLYNRTLQQLNLFHDKLVATQQMSMSFLANSHISMVETRDTSKAELSKLLMSRAVEGK